MHSLTFHYPFSPMSNIIKLAPYAYLAKRSGSNTLYDLLLLVPVDLNGDTDLSNVTVVKPGGTRMTIDYSTNGNAATVPYRFKHLQIDTDGTYLDIEIQGDNNTDRTTLLVFSEADQMQATVTSQYQTCAPYVFIKKETVSNTEKYAHPSCIVLFDAGIGAQTESIVFGTDTCTLTFNLGTSGVSTDPSKFAINQDIKAAIIANGVHTFDGNVKGLSKPPRKQITKMYW